MHASQRRKWNVIVLLTLCGLSPCPASADWPTSPLVNLPVCTAPDQQNPSGLTTDGSGGAIIAWGDSRLGSSEIDIYAQHVLAGGTVDAAWPFNGQLICSAAGVQFNPRILSDGAGGAVVAWQDLRGGTTSDLYAQHVLATGAVDPAWPANGRAICSVAGNQSGISLVSDNSGGAVLTWRDFRVDTTQAVYGQHLLANGQVDAAWPVNGRALLTQPNNFNRPITIRTIPDGHGGAIFAWENFNGGATADIYAQRVRANGTLDPAWPVAGRAVCAAANDQLNPNIISDGAGGAIVCWDDARGAAIDIYAQRVRADGSVDPAWPVDGRLVCAAAGNQQLPQAAADGLGGALIAWVDFRGGVSSDVYAHHVFANGTVDAAWPTDGRAVCTAIGNQNAIVAAPDGTGGVLLGWQDSRVVSSSPDIYAHHVLPSGAVDPAWPANGRAISTATGGQSGLLMLADGSGGAILTWGDQRSGAANADVYAQRVQANGTLGGTVVDVPRAASRALALDAVNPNPWTGGTLTLSFSLSNDAGATLDVIDIAGRCVASQLIVARGPGRRSTTLELGRRLAPGIYLVRLRQGGGVRSRRFAILD